MVDSLHTIDEKWITGVRKWWKRWAGAKKYPGQISSIRALRHRTGEEVLQDAAYAAHKHIDHGMAMLRRLSDDLMVNKGFFTSSPGGKSLASQWKTKVMSEIEAADAALGLADATVTFWANGGHKADIRAVRGNRELRLQRLSDISVVNENLAGISSTVFDAVKRVDSHISRKLLRLLSSLVNHPSAGSIPLDMGGDNVPEAVSLGKATVVFDRRAENKQAMINVLKAAHALLKRSDLGYLWYGRVEYLPKSMGVGAGAKYVATQSDQSGATYHRNGDFLRVFEQLRVQTVIHELGHRYYFKFMSNRERQDFDRHFGDVPATSEYGATDTSTVFQWKGVEDFPELFASYVMGTLRDARQVHRMKAFLGRKRKLEHTLSGQLRDALLS